MEYTTENHNRQILKIGRKNRSMHPKGIQLRDKNEIRVYLIHWIGQNTGNLSLTVNK